MKRRVDETSYRILILLKLDAKRLYERIKYRAPEYIEVFSGKRTRDHFGEIFKSRYDQAKIEDLKYCSEDVIIGLDHFYTKVDDLRWYLNHTEDMPNTVYENVYRFIRELKSSFETLNLYIDAELGVEEKEEAEEIADNIFDPTFNGEGSDDNQESVEIEDKKEYIGS